MQLQGIIAWLIQWFQLLLPRCIHILQPKAPTGCHTRHQFRLLSLEACSPKASGSAPCVASASTWTASVPPGRELADRRTSRTPQNHDSDQQLCPPAPVEAREAQQLGRGSARNPVWHFSSRQHPGSVLATSMLKEHSNLMEGCLEAQQLGTGSARALLSSSPRPLGSGTKPTLQQVRKAQQSFAGSAATLLHSSRRSLGSSPTQMPQKVRAMLVFRSNSLQLPGAGVTPPMPTSVPFLAERIAEAKSRLCSRRQSLKTPAASCANRRGGRRGRAQSLAATSSHRLCQNMRPSLRKGFLTALVPGAACPTSGLCRTTGSQKWGVSLFGTRSLKSSTTPRSGSPELRAAGPARRLSTCPSPDH
mmetsp:Transcript_125861/g.305772  ORF Transcript_125861/g.305772 Transcript_125861/m.305772 type:complete len:362 (+) Transcript_125861:108-1193(+)